MNSLTICIHILPQSFSLVNCFSLVNFFKIKGTNFRKMWFTQDMINGLASTNTFSVTIVQGKGITWCQLGTMIICVEVQKTDGLDLIVCVEFWKLDGSNLKGLVPDTNLVISEIISSSISSLIKTWYYLVGSWDPDTYLGFVCRRF